MNKNQEETRRDGHATKKEKGNHIWTDAIPLEYLTIRGLLLAEGLGL
jgi:hypothetical protein